MTSAMEYAITIRLPGRTYPTRIALPRLGREMVIRAAQEAGESLISRWALTQLDEARGDVSYADAADAAHLDLAAWIRIVLLEACGASALGRQLGRIR